MGSRVHPSGEISITLEVSDGWFVITDEESGVTTQGKTKSEALENLADALRLHKESEADENDIEPSNAPWFK